MVMAYNVTSMKFDHIEINEEDVDISFENDQVLFEARKIGGRLTSFVKRHTIGDSYEEFETHINVAPGGI